MDEKKIVLLRALKNDVGATEDLVGTAVFLASDDSRMVTGQLILHDGGMSMH